MPAATRFASFAAALCRERPQNRLQQCAAFFAKSRRGGQRHIMGSL
jgi:hypothetical protein